MMLPDNFPTIPHSRQYTAPWAMLEADALAIAAKLRGYDMNAHVAARKADPTEPVMPVEYVDGIAVVSVEGVMTKYGSSFFDGYPGNVRMKKLFRDMRSDASVAGVMLRVDSPGGTVAGLGDLANEFHELGKAKPTAAHTEDLCASAAYFLASQANRVSSGAFARVGSIGTYTVIYDWSAAFEKEGIKAIVVRSGEFKGVGTQGEKLSEEHLAELQRQVDAYADEFVRVVARGRNSIQDVKALADGRIHTPEDAKSLGLVDAVEDYDSALASLRGRIESKSRRGRVAAAVGPSVKGNTMNEDSKDVKPTAEAPKAATIGEIKAAIPDASSESIVVWLEKGYTLAQCKDAQLDVLRAKANVAEEEATKAKASAAKVGVVPVKNGVKASTDDDADAGDAKDEWEAAVRAEQEKGGRDAEGNYRIDGMAARRAVAKKRPDLHQSLVTQTNKAAGRPNLVVAAV